MNKQTIIIFLSLGISVSSCQNKTANRNLPVASIFTDSLYTFFNYTGLVNDTLHKFYPENATQVDSTTKKKVLDNFYPFYSSYWSLTDIKYVARQHMVRSIQPIILSIVADDYGALVLVNFNPSGEVVDRIELSGGACGGPDQEDDSILVLCPYTHSVIIDSNHISLYKIRSMYSAFLSDTSLTKTGKLTWVGYDSIPLIDSLSYTLEIKESGKIVSTLVDSVRIDMHKKNNI